MSDKKWLIALDLDGTTLMSKKPFDERVTEEDFKDQIHPVTKDAVTKLLDLGHKVVLCTGRSWYQSEPNYKDLGLNSYSINSAGGHIHNPSNPEDPEFIESIPNAIAKEILADEYVMERVTGWCADDVNDTYLIDTASGWFKEAAESYWNTRPFNGEFEFDTQCMVIFFERTPDEINEVVEYMREKWGDIVHTTNWATTGGYAGGIELNPAKSNKGTALLKVAEVLGIDKENTIGIGDGENDLELIRMAEHGVCMSHGVDYIKQHANHVTEFDNNEGGVGHFLNKFFNLK